MRRMSLALVGAASLLLSACQDPGSSGPTMQFDGRYAGSGRGLLATCPWSGQVPVTGQVQQGQLALAVGSGRTVTARIDRNGTLHDVRLASESGWTGASSGTGSVEGGEVRVNLTVSPPNGNFGCVYEYRAQRVG